MFRRSYDSNGYAPSSEINKSNVSQLKAVFTYATSKERREGHRARSVTSLRSWKCYRVASATTATDRQGSRARCEPRPTLTLRKASLGKPLTGWQSPFSPTVLAIERPRASALGCWTWNVTIEKLQFAPLESLKGFYLETLSYGSDSQRGPCPTNNPSRSGDRIGRWDDGRRLGR